jgi:lysophospholipase L1-like esterase
MSAPTHAGFSRRSVLRTAASLGALGALGAWRAEVRAAAPKTELRKGEVILFQGDSITDAGRNKGKTDPNDVDGLGRGYAVIAAGEILGQHAEQRLKVYNRGISGHKVPDLVNRWQGDTVDLKPDILSILIGVNDMWHKLNGRYDGTVETYETGYRGLLLRTRREIPGVRIVVCEPFALRCGAVNDHWFPEFDQRRAVASKLAEELKLDFVPFQSMFDKATECAPPNFWAGDGVHPSLAGHALMAQTWRDVLGF